MDYSPKKMNELLNKHTFYFKKNYGQNFIIDENIIKSIIYKSDIKQNSLVIEIGPGAGSLSYYLASSCKNLLCYEIDNRLEKILEDNLSKFKNIEIKFCDFLKANVIDDIKKYEYNKLYIIANLPYYITTPIILKIIEDKIPVDKMCFMVQKEVGDRFKSLPGSKDYSSILIYLAYYFQIKKIMDVSKNVFLPKPNVDSIVLEFTKKEENNYGVINEELFFKIVRESFKQKRKTLLNNLKEFDKKIIINTLINNGYSLSVRAEELSIEFFVLLSNELNKATM